MSYDKWVLELVAIIKQPTNKQVNGNKRIKEEATTKKNHEKNLDFCII